MMTHQKMKSYSLPGKRELQIIQGDITRVAVDCIVNAANELLQHGGGVAGAIALEGGSEIQRESDRWLEEHGPVPHGKPAFTAAGRLPCQYVIHAVGPVWGSGDEDRKLAAAVRGSLERADELGLSSIAFPAISTGIFGFPAARAAQVMLSGILDYFAAQPDSPLYLVMLVLFDEQMRSIFVKVSDSLTASGNQGGSS
jgi:O-acetyl-ADP-ribose deacetylase (regulator of RNase III)